MRRLKELLFKGRQYMENSAKRFPEAILAAAVMVMLGIYVNHVNEYEEEIGKMVLTLLLGLPHFVSFVLLKEKLDWENKRRQMGSIIISLLCLLFYFLLPEDLDGIFFIRYMTGLIISFIILVWYPTISKGKTFSRYILYIIASFFTTYFFTLVLYGGLSGLVFAIESLFDLSIDGEVYVDMLMIAVGIFGVGYFLGTLPNEGEDLMATHEPKVFKILFTVIVIPLIWAYTAVLYAYLIRILLQWSWPEGIVGHLVLWYGLVVMLTQFAIKDFRDKKKWVSFFEAWYPHFFIVPLIMMFITIIIRINAYGITLLRFFYVAVALWYFFNTLYRITYKKYSNMILLISGIVLMIVSVYSPFNGIKVGFYSQNQRLEDLLVTNDILIDGQIFANETLTKEKREEINSIIRYFDHMDSLDEIAVLPEGFELNDMEETFGFKYQYYYYDRGEYFAYNSEVKPLYNVTDYDYMVFISRRWVEEDPETLSYSVNIDYETQVIGVYKRDELVLEESFITFFKGHEKHFESEVYDVQEMIEIDHYLSGEHLHFEFYNISGQGAGPDIEFNYMEGYLMIQEK